MSTLCWMILGGLAAWTASASTGSRDGVLMDFIAGMVGALIAGIAVATAGSAGLTGLNVWSLLVAVTAMAVLIIAVPVLRKQPDQQGG